MVVRRYIKSCAKLELSKNYFKDYHRNHLSKEVMTTMFTVYTFKDNIENRGRQSNWDCLGIKVTKL